MTRRILIGFFCFAVACSAKAQFDSSFIKKNIRHCADSLTFAFKTRNWEVFARYSYPAMVASIGGRQEFINYIARAFSQAPDSAWKRYEAGKILQVIKKDRD